MLKLSHSKRGGRRVFGWAGASGLLAAASLMASSAARAESSYAPPASSLSPSAIGDAPVIPAPPHTLEENASTIRISSPPREVSSSSDQLLSFHGGLFQPDTVGVSNGTYSFDYGSKINSYQVGGTWALKLFRLGGAFYFEEGLDFSSFSGRAVQSSTGAPLPAGSYSLGILGFDTRLMYSADLFPWKSLIPFADAGYRYSVFYQPGSSAGVDSASGGIGNFAAGAGLRFWLNRAASMTGSAPLFISAKIDRIFPQADSLNLGSTSFVGGLTIGL